MSGNKVWCCASSSQRGRDGVEVTTLVQASQKHHSENPFTVFFFSETLSYSLSQENCSDKGWRKTLVKSYKVFGDFGDTNSAASQMIHFHLMADDKQ